MYKTIGAMDPVGERSLPAVIKGNARHHRSTRFGYSVEMARQITEEFAIGLIRRDICGSSALVKFRFTSRYILSARGAVLRAEVQ